MSKLDAALALAAQGVKVHPVSPATKAPLTKHGHLDGTTNPDAIRQWWAFWPDAWPGMNLAASGLVVAAPDSPEWLATFEQRGMETPARWQSPSGAGHVHAVFRRPTDCPTTRICRTGEYDVMSDGYSIAYLADAAAVPTLNGGLPDAPVWVVEMLTEAAAAKARPAQSTRADASEEPPVELPDHARAVWQGTHPKLKPDGTTDRSATLLKIGRVLYDAGMTRRGVVTELEDRDHALGYHKFCCDRKDGGARYGGIMDELERSGRQARGYLESHDEAATGAAEEATAAADCPRCETLRGQVRDCRREGRRIVATVRSVLKDQRLTPGERLAAIGIAFTVAAHEPKAAAKAAAASAKAARLTDIGSPQAKAAAREADRLAAEVAAGEVRAFGPALAAESGLPRRTFDSLAKKLQAKGLITKRSIPIRQTRPNGAVPLGELKQQLLIAMPGASIADKLESVAGAAKEERAKAGGWRPPRCLDCKTAAVLSQTTYICAGCGQPTYRTEARVALPAIEPDAPRDGQNGHETTGSPHGQNGHVGEAATGAEAEDAPEVSRRRKDVPDGFAECRACGKLTTVGRTLCRPCDQPALDAEDQPGWLGVCRTPDCGVPSLSRGLCKTCLAAENDGVVRSGGRALLVQHCAVFGRVETEVRQFNVGEVRPYAQYPCSVSVRCVEPRKRTPYFVTMKPENQRYLTMEVDGRVVYDSRTDVPCDMEQWNQTNARFAERRLFSSEEAAL